MITKINAHLKSLRSLKAKIIEGMYKNWHISEHDRDLLKELERESMNLALSIRGLMDSNN